jgi:hypothetical protein
MKNFLTGFLIGLGGLIIFLVAKYVPFITHKPIDQLGFLAESCLGYGPECMEKFNEKITLINWLAVQQQKALD